MEIKINIDEEFIEELAEKVNMNCKDCKWYYKEHCSNGISDNCTEMVREDDTCEHWEDE